MTLNELHGYIKNFLLYKIIYFSSHKFAFSNFHFSPFYEHFRQLRVQIKNKVHHVNQLIEPDLMIFPLKKSLHSTPPTQLHALHLPIQNILLAVNPFYCFFCKKLVGREKIE